MVGEWCPFIHTIPALRLRARPSEAVVEFSIAAAITRVPLGEEHARWLSASAVLTSLVVVSFLSSQFCPGAGGILTVVVLVSALSQLALRPAAGLGGSVQLAMVLAAPPVACIGGLLARRTRPVVKATNGPAAD